MSVTPNRLRNGASSLASANPKPGRNCSRNVEPGPPERPLRASIAAVTLMRVVEAAVAAAICSFRVRRLVPREHPEKR